MKTPIKAFLLATALVAAAPASAHIEMFAATLDGLSEFPSNSSPGTGSALITFDDDLATMRVQVTFSGLSGLTTASHIHCCTANPFLKNAGVAMALSSFPAGVMAGTYDQTFSLGASASFNPAFVTANGPLLGNAVAAFQQGIAAGRAYLNIHTSLVPSGEIRGFLVAVPEPETYAMFLAGLGVLAVAGARRHRS